MPPWQRRRGGGGTCTRWGQLETAKLLLLDGAATAAARRHPAWAAAAARAGIPLDDLEQLPLGAFRTEGASPVVRSPPMQEFAYRLYNAARLKKLALVLEGLAAVRVRVCVGGGEGGLGGSPSGEWPRPRARPSFLCVCLVSLLLATPSWGLH